MTSLLDELEEFYGDSDERNLYERRVVTVQREALEEVKAYTYYCVGDLADYAPVEMEPEADGTFCWQTYTERHQLRTAGGEWKSKEGSCPEYVEKLV